MMKMFYICAVQYVTVTRPIWLLSAWNVLSETEEMIFLKFHFILIDKYKQSHMVSDYCIGQF